VPAEQPLKGVRVLDLTRVLAGPYCAMLLGDMGAEVIKVEEPGKGDDTRGWPPFAGGESTYFMSVNRNKKSITLNLKAPEGREILKKLARKSDVVLENFRTGTMEKLGLGYTTLARLNPRLVYCAISGFGESGPESHRGGYDLIVQAESGVMDLTGFSDGPPVKVGNSIADLVAGMSGAHGVTLALLARQKTRRGQKVEIAMLDVMASLLTYQAGMYLNAGRTPARRGSVNRNWAPSPGRPHAWSQPPCRWVSSSEIDSPRPVPPLVRARAGSARQKRLKTSAASPGARPRLSRSRAWSSASSPGSSSPTARPSSPGRTARCSSPTSART